MTVNTKEDARREVNRRNIVDLLRLEKSKSELYYCPTCESGNGKIIPEHLPTI